jgi:uncharacterized UBP type Zn finger protein
MCFKKRSFLQIIKADTSLMQALTSMLQGQDGIPPRMFKSLIGTGHPEFASSRQQVYNGSFLFAFY